MRELVKLIGEWEGKLYGFGELCERHGISRKTGYKWLGRYESEGVEGLRVRSHAPLSCPHRMAAATAAAIVEVRRKHPRWGGRKILDYLRRHQPKLELPAPSSAGALLVREGLVTKQRRPPAAWRHPGHPRVRPTEPNELWTVDFKGLQDRRRCVLLPAHDRR